MTAIPSPMERVRRFCDEYNLQVPILMAPMAGACPASLASAVAKAGGMGACGALLMKPDAIKLWVADFRASTNGSFQLNTWIPDPAPERDLEHEAAVREFLAQWGPEVPDDAADAGMPDFEAQCAAMLQAGPQVISSIMGLYPSEFVAEMKSQNVKWFATVTTVAEAVQAEQAGADVIVAQGMEAGGHRGVFNSEDAEASLVGLFSLLPAVVDTVDVPVVATGGIADARGTAAAIALGASAVQIGTGLLRSPEAGLSSAWADAIAQSKPEDTMPTRAFSGRLGRSVKSAYTVAAASTDAPAPAPYPIQRNLTQPMRAKAAKDNNIDTMQAWAGQSASLARDVSAEKIVSDIWQDAQAILSAS